MLTKLQRDPYFVISEPENRKNKGPLFLYTNA